MYTMYQKLEQEPIIIPFLFTYGSYVNVFVYQKLEQETSGKWEDIYENSMVGATNYYSCLHDGIWYTKYLFGPVCLFYNPYYLIQFIIYNLGKEGLLDYNDLACQLLL